MLIKGVSKLYCDVAVIGGGVIGSSASYYLSRKNFDVILLEKKEINSGASGACDGFISLQSKKDFDLILLTLKSIGMFEKLGDLLSFDIEYERCGGFLIYSSKYDISKIDLSILENACYKYEINKDILENKGNKKNSSSPKVLNYQICNSEKFIQIFDNKVLKKFEPFISDDVSFGTFCSQEGHVNPIALNLAYSFAAKKNGARKFLKEEVKGFEIKDYGIVKRIFTSSGKQIFANEVLICAGAWSGSLGILAGVDIPIKPRKGIIIVTEVLPPVINHPIIDYDYLCCKFEVGKETGFTIEQTRSGNLLIGSTREFCDFNNTFDLKKITNLLERAVHFFPLLSEVNIIRIFNGFRPYSIDLKPFIGLLPGFLNLWIASGHEGDGIALSPVTGELISKLIERKIEKLKDLELELKKDLNKEDVLLTFYNNLYDDIKGYEGINIRKFSPERRINVILK